MIKNLIENEGYFKAIIPHLQVERIEDSLGKVIIKEMLKHHKKYKSSSNWDNLMYSIDKAPNEELNPTTKEEIISLLNDIKKDTMDKQTLEFLIKETEHHFQEVVLSNNILLGAKILNSQEKHSKKHQLPGLMKDALKISFDKTTGVEYSSELSMEEQYNHYRTQDLKFPLYDWKIWNDLTRGGFCKKKVHVIMANTHVGKTLCLINIVSQLIKNGLNVLHITLEDGEYAIQERYDALFLQQKTEDLHLLSKDQYKIHLRNLFLKERIKKSINKVNHFGRLIIKEFPTSTASVLDFEHLLDDLELKEDFRPDFVIIDYLNICKPVGYNNVGDMYIYVKRMIEEIRAFAVSNNIGVFTATQSNRKGHGVSDIDLDDTSESWGVPMTADWMWGMVQTTSLKIKGQYLIKQMKNRYKPIDLQNERFYMKVNVYKQTMNEIDDPWCSEVENTSKTVHSRKKAGSEKKFTNVKWEDNK